MNRLLITTAAIALLAGPALAGGKPHDPKPQTPTPQVPTSTSTSSAGAAALGVGVGIGIAEGGKGGNADAAATSISGGGDAKAYGGSATSGVYGSGNSSSASGVYGSGNADVRSTNLQATHVSTKIGDVSATTGDSLSTSSVGDLSTGASTSTSSADGSNNASMNVDARTFNPEHPVSTAVGSVTFQPNCSKGMAGGLQLRDVGVSLGGGKDQEWCVVSNLAASMHGFGETQAAVRIMCLEPRVQKANPALCARPEDYKPAVQIEYRDRIVYRDAPAMAPIPNPPTPAPKAKRRARPTDSQRSLEDYCEQAAKVCKAIH